MSITTHKSKKSSCANWLKPGKYFKPFVILNDTQWSSVFTSLIASDTHNLSACLGSQANGAMLNYSSREGLPPPSYTSSAAFTQCSYRCYRNRGDCWHRVMHVDLDSSFFLWALKEAAKGSHREFKGLCAAQGNSCEKRENKNISEKPSLDHCDQHRNFPRKKRKK